VPHGDVAATWPGSGRHVLASFDEATVVVYQAYRPSIGRFAATHGFFGGDFSFSRMSWVKPNFLWMMYRSGWGTKEGQEITLAVRVTRAAFDGWLAAAVPSSHVRELHATREEWQQAVAASDVRMQWDPDHAPDGTPLERRAVQLGLRGEALARYARDQIVSIEDISADVAREREHLRSGATLCVPRERVYPLSATTTA
jgi:hypothetical protein